MIITIKYLHILPGKAGSIFFPEFRDDETRREMEVLRLSIPVTNTVCRQIMKPKSENLLLPKKL